MFRQNIESLLKERKHQFLHFRWLLFIWLGAVAALKAGGVHDMFGVYILLGVFLASQALLAWAPLRFFEGMKVLQAMFLLDQCFMFLAFWHSGQAQPELLITLSLGTFIAALTHNLSQSFLSTLVIVAIYVALRYKEPGFDMMQASQLVQIPILFIASAHSSLLAQEAAGEVEARRLLEGSKRLLSKQMNSTFVQVARQCKDLSALVDALPFGALMLDAQGRVGVVNDIAEEVMGLTAGAAIGMGLDSHPNLSLLRPYLEKSFSDPLTDFTAIEIPSDGGDAWTLSLGVYPVREGEETRGLLLVLIPQGYSEKLTEALPKPLILPSESERILLQGGLEPSYPGLSLPELGLSYG